MGISKCSSNVSKTAVSVFLGGVSLIGISLVLDSSSSLGSTNYLLLALTILIGWFGASFIATSVWIQAASGNALIKSNKDRVMQTASPAISRATADNKNGRAGVIRV